MGQQQTRTDQVAAATALWQTRVGEQRRAIGALRAEIHATVGRLTQRIGRLRAQLDGLGPKVSDQRDAPPRAGNESADPPVGGPSNARRLPIVADLNAAADELQRQVDARERQLRVLRAYFVTGEHHANRVPAGRPVSQGWVSSGYGWRADPFNGGQALHQGVDFAGYAGSDVLAVAAGVVTTAAMLPGYGLLLEINHGNGYVTRYGHNRKALVAVGERVEAGARIAEMGSTGRSTGPHVHFEVLDKGVIVDPRRYIRAPR